MTHFRSVTFFEETYFSNFEFIYKIINFKSFKVPYGVIQQNLLYPNKFVSASLADLISSWRPLLAFIWDSFNKSFYHIFGELYQMEMVDYDFSEFSYELCYSPTNDENHSRHGFIFYVLKFSY